MNQPEQAGGWSLTVRRLFRLARNFSKAVETLDMIVNPEVLVYILPGGTAPKRMTAGAIAFDVGLSRIVSPHEMDEEKSYLRKTIFDFEKMPSDQFTSVHVAEKQDDKGPPELVYKLYPHESVTVGTGIITAMQFPMFFWGAPRSGLASKLRVTLANAPCTIDPDYRGEAGIVLQNEGSFLYELRRGMRIAQCIFDFALIPKLKYVDRYEDLPKTDRGPGGFGSTGIR